MKTFKLLIMLLGITTLMSCSEEDIKRTQSCTLNDRPVSCSKLETLKTSMSGKSISSGNVEMNLEEDHFIVDESFYDSVIIGTINDEEVECGSGLERGKYDFVYENGKLSLTNTSNEQDVADIFIPESSSYDDLNETRWFYSTTFIDNDIQAKGRYTVILDFSEDFSSLKIEAECTLNPL
ncbi:hypothetical protein [Halobacteriovorax sp. HLS]|uniref:hypothetical protein n=1 Tax=Halobacteriovorax sp. HLS TaxID=2234000 RepID=UPI000FDB3296|nr:hypothetical protein [Halobacteriovorax sp. HLS]